MIDRTHYALAALLLLSPGAALAQHAAAAPHPAPAPAVTPAPDGWSFPADAVEDERMWFDDEWLAFGLGDDFLLDAGDLAGDDLAAGDDETTEETVGPDGDRRIVIRRRLGDDDDAGPGHRMGLGMHGPGGMPGMMGPHGPGGPMMHRRLAMRLARLDLTDAQRDKLRALHEAQARKAIQRRADMQLARLDLHRLMSAEKPDPAAVNAQIDRLARLHADGLKSAFDTHLQARAVLTPEQLKQLHGAGAAHGMQHEMMDAPGGHPKR